MGMAAKGEMCGLERQGHVEKRGEKDLVNIDVACTGQTSISEGKGQS